MLIFPKRSVQFSTISNFEGFVLLEILFILISFFLLSLVIIPPLSSQAVQKMLMQDPYFVIFAKEDGNSKLLVNLVHLSPFNDIQKIMLNEWTEASQIHFLYSLKNHNFLCMLHENLLIFLV